MNRPIMFRAWSKPELKFYRNVALLANGEYHINSSFNIFEDPTKLGSDYAVQQSTSFMDKNGVEVYEGDILEIKVYGSQGACLVTERVPVVWKNQSFGVRWGTRQGFTRFDGFVESTTFEVVGHIHEARD